MMISEDHSLPAGGASANFSATQRGSFLLRALQLIAAVGATAILIWGFTDARFRDGEGFLKAEVCLPIAATAALLLLGLAVSTKWNRFASWLALALVGQAAALQMIDAGPLIHYQYYRTIPQLLANSGWVPLLCLLFQAAIVLIFLARRLTTIWSWLRKNFELWQLAAIVLVMIFAGAAGSRDKSIYLNSLALAALVHFVGLANIVLAVLSVPKPALASLEGRLDRTFGRSAATAESPRLSGFVVAAAIWVTIVAGLLSFFSYERHPHVPDEVVYLYHARYLASGVLTLPVPPVPEGFDLYLMENDGNRWYAAPPPAWPTALAVGEFFGVPWLVNPILGGVNVLLAYFLVSAIYDRRIANWVVLLMAASPWALFMAMNFMTHTFTLTCALTAGLGLVQSKRTRKASWALLAGGAIGMASLIRPLDGLIVAVVIGLAALGLGGRRLTIPSLAALALGTILVGAAVLPYNKFLTGKATVFPLMAYTDRHFGPNTNALGFGPDRGLGWPLQPFPGHSPLGAIINSNLNIFSLDTELLGWSVGSLLLLALLLLAGRIRGADFLMLGVIVLVFVLHFFYWYSGGPDFGARYWFLMLLPLLVLTARAVRFLEEKFAASTEESPTNGSGRVRLAVLALCAITAVTYIPWRAIDKYHHYLRMRPDVRNLARQHNFGSSLVLIRGDGHPDYASAAVYNPLNLRDEVPIYAWDRSPEVRAQLLKAYAGRPVYIVDGPSITSGGFKVVKGPVTTNYLLRSLGQLGQPDDVNAR